MDDNCQVIKNAVITNDVLSTNKDLEPGDIVLQLPAVVCGPGRGKQPVCIGCLHLGDKDRDLVPCSSCSWPVCSAECAKSELHEKECALFNRSGVKSKISNFNEATTDLDFVTPLRFLTKLASDTKLKEKFDKFQTSYSDVKERNVEVYSPTSDGNIVKFIIDIMKCGYDSKEIERTIAIIEKFSMPLDCGAVCMYEELPTIAHSCSPNTYHMILTTRSIVFRAAAAIKNGTVITYCKSDMAKCNLFRRRLMKKLCISCECERCKDGTEFGTGFGSLQCKDCDGLVSSTDSRNEGAEWKCEGCKNKINGKECIAILDQLNTKLENLSKSADDNKETVINFEKLLTREGEWKQFPVNSQFFLDIRYRLIYIYGYHKYFYQTGEDNAKVKMDHCDEWFKLTQMLFPGRSYPNILIEFEKINGAVSLMNDMKQNFKPVAEVNTFIAEINKMGTEPLAMMLEEEDQSLCNAFKQMLMVATEAREMQKQRVLINRWADEDDEW